jgi:hypothetical protein
MYASFGEQTASVIRTGNNFFVAKAEADFFLSFFLALSKQFLSSCHWQNEFVQVHVPGLGV